MPAIPDALAAALRQSHEPVTVVQFLGQGFDVLHEVDGRFVGGSVTMEHGREEPRNADVALVNDAAGTFSPSGPSALVWPFRLVRIFRGARISGTPVLAPIITGVLDEPKDGTRTREVSFGVWSRLRLLNTEFPQPMSFDAGTRIATIVRAVCELGGMGVDDDLYVLDDGGTTAADVIAWDVTDNMLRALSEMTTAHACELDDDGLGRVVLRPTPDPSTLPSVWTFDRSADSLRIDLSSTRRANRVFNRAIVEGIGPDHYPVRSEARDLNPLSPTFNPVDGSGPVGDRPAPPFVSALIHTQAQANAVARALLVEITSYTHSIDSSAVPIPGIEHGDVVTFGAPGVSGPWRLKSVTMPLRTGTMRMTSTMVRSMLAPS